MQCLAAYKEIFLLIAVLAWMVALIKCRRPWMLWLGAQLLAALLVEALGKWMGARGFENQWLYNAYMLAEYALLTMVLIRIGEALDRRTRGVMGVAAFLFAAFFLWDVSDAGTFRLFASNALIIGGFILGSVSAWVLLKLADKSDGSLIPKPEFWLLLAIMGYFLCTAPMFGLYNHLSDSNPSLGRQVYGFNDLLFALRYGLTAVSLCMLAKTRNP